MAVEQQQQQTGVRRRLRCPGDWDKRDGDGGTSRRAHFDRVDFVDSMISFIFLAIIIKNETNRMAAS